MPSSNKDLVLAVDIGGTKIAATIAGRNGKRMGRTTAIPTPQTGSASEWISSVGEALHDIVRHSGYSDRFAGVYYSTVGPMREVAGGLRIFPPNIAPLRQVGLHYPAMLSEVLGLPFGFDNDGNTALAAEVLDAKGAAAGAENAAVLVWSSGVGCGFYSQGKLLHFEARDPVTWADPALSDVVRNSFEVGHVFVEGTSAKLQCGDGAWGHLEAHLGGKAAEERHEIPKESHARFMEAGRQYLPQALAMPLQQYGIDLVVVTGALGKALLNEHPEFAGELSDAFAQGAGGHAVAFKASAIDNASLRGAQLLGLQALERDTFVVPAHSASQNSSTGLAGP